MTALTLVIGCREGRQLMLGTGDGSAATSPDAGSVDRLATGAGGSPHDAATDATDAIGSDGRGPAMLVLDRSAYDFGTVVVGAGAPDTTFVVSNAGGGTSGLLVVQVGGGASGFSLRSTTCTGGLPASNMCKVVVALTPSAPGPLSAMLVVSGNPGGLLMVGLTATAVAAGVLEVSPVSQTFADTAPGATSSSQTVLVRNKGGSPAGTTAPLAVTLGGNNPNDFTVAANSCAGLSPFNAGSTCGFTVAFSPTSGGAKNATISVTANPGGTAVLVLAGTAPSVAMLTLEPAAGSSASFGTQNIGQATPEDFTVTNTGQLVSSPITVTLTATAGAGFGLAPPSLNDCNSGATTLAPGASCNIEVRFTPMVNGGAAATLGVSAAMGGTPAPLVLTAMGTSPAHLVPTTTSLDLGSLPVGTPGSGSVMLTNTGNGVSGVPTVTPGTTELSIVSNGCTAALIPGASCTISFRLTPAMTGMRDVALTVAANPGGPVIIYIMATGI